MQNTITYLKWLELQNYKHRSIQTLISLKNQLENYLNEQALELSTEHLKHFASWASDQGYSLVYQRQLHWGVWVYCRYLKQVQGLKIQAYLSKIKQVDNRRKALNETQLKTIATWLKKEQKNYWLNQALWTLFYGCGLWRTEALNLELKDLNISQKLLSVATIKGGRKRLLPLSKKQLGALVNYINEERCTPKESYQNKLFIGKRGGKAAHLLAKQLHQWQEGTELGAVLCWHVLRHSIATELVQKGMKLEEVSRFLGHSSIESTTRYLHYNPISNEL